MVSKHFPTKYLLITNEKRVTHRSLAYKTKLRDTVKNNQPVIFRNVRIRQGNTTHNGQKVETTQTSVTGEQIHKCDGSTQRNTTGNKMQLGTESRWNSNGPQKMLLSERKQMPMSLYCLTHFYRVQRGQTYRQKVDLGFGLGCEQVVTANGFQGCMLEMS